jgi:GNAT superfamily N-acetyltransferase
MKMNVRIATKTDLEFLLANDRHISPNRLENKIRDGLIYITCDVSSPVAWLRFSYFWDIIPFMNLLYVLEANRGEGVGRAIVKKWGSDMFHSGADFVLTSTQADENAQHFYRKLGYQDCGAIFVPKQIPTEIFLRKMKPIAG